MEMKLKIGSKGELYIPKKLRKELSLSPGDFISVVTKGQSLVISKVVDLIELFQKPPLTEGQSAEDIETEINELINSQIKTSQKEI